MNKAYKFRLYPNKEQKEMFHKTFGCARFIYNKMLADKIDYYNETGKKLNNTPAQYKTEFPFLKEVDSLALCNAQINLQSAYNNFFRDKKVGFPKFKSKKKSKLSYTTNNQGSKIHIKGNYIKLPKIGYVKLKAHRLISNDEIIKSCTISMTPTGKYYISILVEYEKQIIQSNNYDNILGLDMDMKNLYTASDDTIGEYPRYYRRMLDKLKKEQRKLSKRKRGGSNYNKQRKKVAKLHEKVANQRKDFLHKKSREITNRYSFVAIEDLDMRAMSQTLHLGKSVMDNGWGMFTIFLKYKLEDKGGKLVKIDKWFPSSKMCRHCGEVNSELTLNDRQWICPSCGALIERDYNASINIKNEGLRILRSV